VPNRLRRAPWRLIAAILTPVAVFVVLLATLHDELLALTITEAIPIGWALVIGLRRRRLDPLALALAVVLTAAVVVSLATGGSVLPLKLRRALITGSLGIACVASVLVRRPLLPTAMIWAARAWPRSERLLRLLDAHTARRKMMILTAIIGVTLLGDAAAQVTLALTVSTATFPGASRLARIAVFGAGLGACGLYLRRAPAGTPPRSPDLQSGPSADRRSGPTG
jgi:hypothetical protein